MLKSIGRYRCVLISVSMGQLRVEVAEAMAEFDRKEAQMVQSVTYQRETRTVPFQGRTIVLEILTPVLSSKEKERRKKEIERCLYDVLSKYRQSRCCPRQHCPPGLSMV